MPSILIWHENSWVIVWPSGGQGQVSVGTSHELFSGTQRQNIPNHQKCPQTMKRHGALECDNNMLVDLLTGKSRPPPTSCFVTTVGSKPRSFREYKKTGRRVEPEARPGKAALKDTDPGGSYDRLLLSVCPFPSLQSSFHPYRLPSCTREPPPPPSNR